MMLLDEVMSIKKREDMNTTITKFVKLYERILLEKNMTTYKKEKYEDLLQQSLKMQDYFIKIYAKKLCRKMKL
jgi:hypothetical protein